MKKAKRKIQLLRKSFSTLTIIILIFSCITAFALQASAYATWGNSKMIDGVGQSGNYTRCYWYDTNSLSTTWQNRVNNSMTAWCNTGSQGCGVYTSVWFTHSTVKSNSVIDFYASSNLPSGVYGLTSLYTGTGSNSTPVYPSSSSPIDWVWAKIQVNTSYCDSGDYALTTTQKKAMVEHEIGHAFGLAHVTTAKSRLMYPYANTCTASQPTKYECKGVNSLYGGYNP